MAITERFVTAAAAGGGDGTSGSPWTIYEAQTNAVSGDRVNCLDDSTYSLTANFNPVNSGGVDQLILWRGYSVTPGDGGMVTFDVGSSYAFSISSTIGLHRFDNISFNSSAGECFTTNGGGQLVFNNCRLLGARALVLRDPSLFYNCLLEATGSECAYVDEDDGAEFINCSLKTGTPGGRVVRANRRMAAIRCKFYGTSSTSAISTSVRRIIVSHCSIQGCNNGVEFNSNATTPIGKVLGCVMWGTGNAGYGVSIGASTVEAATVIAQNAIGNFGTGRIDSQMDDIPEIGGVTLTANPFNADWTLNSDAGGGALCRGVVSEAPDFIS